MKNFQKTLILGMVLLLVGTSFTSLVGSICSEDQTHIITIDDTELSDDINITLNETLGENEWFISIPSKQNSVNDVSSTINDEDEVEFTIDGPTHGKSGTPYPYIFYLSLNPESDVFDLLVWWGKGFGFGYGPFPTGEDIVIYHAWRKDWWESGTYTIEATAICGNSTYEATLEVTMPMNQQTTYSLFLRFLERFPRVISVVDFTNARAILDTLVSDNSNPSGCNCEGCELEINFTSNPYSQGISLIIKNIGHSDCTNVIWKVVFDGWGFILMANPGFISGSIPLLQPGESETINSGLIFGLGRTTILGWADSYEGSPVWDNMEFKIFLFFIKPL